MSCLVSNEQVRMYNEVKGYSGDEVYLRMLERAYKCLKKVLICSVIFIVIGSVLSVACIGLIYRYTVGILSNEILIGVLNLCLFVLIFVLIMLLVVLAGIVIVKNFADVNELDFLNGVFMEHANCRELGNGKVILNSNGVFLNNSEGKLVKLLDDVPEGIKVELHEYYEISKLYILKRVSEYVLLDSKNHIICKVR